MGVCSEREFYCEVARAREGSFGFQFHWALAPTDTETVMMIRPCKPRDSARPALLTAVRNRRICYTLLQLDFMKAGRRRACVHKKKIYFSWNFFNPGNFRAFSSNTVYSSGNKHTVSRNFIAGPRGATVVGNLSAIATPIRHVSHNS